LKYYSEKGDQPTTIRKRLKSLVSFVNWCSKQGYTNHKISVIPFNHNFEKEVVYLTREEVLQLYQYEEFNFSNKNHKKHTNEFFYDELKNGKTNTYTNLEVYKDILVFGCGVGCRFGDLISLRLDNYQFSEDRSKGYFVFRMEKSRTGKQVKVPINRLTFEIWKKYSKNKKRTDYIFPRSSSGNLPTNQKMNKQIKEIGKIVGLNRLVSKPKFNVEGKIINESDTRVPIHSVLSSHIMRRTFIREGIENKIPTHVMMSMSGHSTERVYHQYFSTTSSELDEEGRKLFSLELNQKKDEKFNNQDSLENRLLELKSLFEKGLIPEDIYLKKVSRLV
jgi:integrase